MPNGEPSSNPPDSVLRGTLWLAQKYGLHAAIAVCLTALICWFYWQSELRNREKDKFIQDRLLGEIANAAAASRDLVEEINESSNLRKEAEISMDRTATALDRNSQCLEETQQVLKETQRVIKEKM